ncbi:MAG: hypothetical protein U0625_04125 [Phycisphaerales bacterium]
MRRSTLGAFAALAAGLLASTALAQNPNCASAQVVVLGSTPFACNSGWGSVLLSGASTSTIYKVGYFAFTPAVTGAYTIDLCGSTNDTKLAIGATCPGASFAALAYNDDACACAAGCGTTGTNAWSSKIVDVALTGGTTYIIAVGSFGSTTNAVGGTMVITVAPPPPDPCDNANQVAGVVGVNPVAINTAYPELDLTGFCTAFTVGDKKIWNARYIKFVAPTTGLYQINTCGDTGNSVDSRLAVLTSCGDPSSSIACDDDSCQNPIALPFTSKLIDVPMTAGQTYFIACGGFSNSITGPFNVTIEAPPAPPCPADLDGNGVVDGADLGRLLGNWGGTGGGDIDGSGVVDGADLGLLLGAWGACP